MLVRCLYASRAVEPLAANALDRILEKSRRNNPPRGITGLLCYSNGIFVQVLEGGRGAGQRAARNDLHRQPAQALQILMFEEIGERHFGNWTMGKVNIDTVNGAALLKYSEKAELDPFNAPDAQRWRCWIELASTGSIASRG